jgi:hypothetical protein
VSSPTAFSATHEKTAFGGADHVWQDVGLTGLDAFSSGFWVGWVIRRGGAATDVSAICISPILGGVHSGVRGSTGVHGTCSLADVVAGLLILRAASRLLADAIVRDGGAVQLRGKIFFLDGCLGCMLTRSGFGCNALRVPVSVSPEALSL